MRQLTAAEHDSLVERLRRPGVWPGVAGAVRRIDTHISTVLLAGDYAYKLKKPVDYGFLDFSTREKRRYFCEEELRLNRRLAPTTYIGVVPVTGSIDDPRPGGDGPALDWMVKMHRFAGDRVLADEPSRIDAAVITDLAHTIAEFHRQAAVVTPRDAHGRSRAVLEPVDENFAQIRQWCADRRALALLDELQAWVSARFQSLRAVFDRRRQQGYVRECHGDLHLGNITLQDGRPLIFDGIEFSPALRWIDVLSDLAFLVMDLQFHGMPGPANHLLNAYLEQTGDYGGVVVLDFYRVYRAMVKAKVAAIRSGQPGLAVASRNALGDECLAYLAFARTATRPAGAGLIITHGVSGSGKTHMTEPLLEGLPALRVRSDVERKRLAGLAPTDRLGGQDAEILYAAGMTDQTYALLRTLAGAIIDSGRLAVLDATFLQSDQRDRCRALAAARGVPYLILDFEVATATLRDRLRARGARGDDVSDAGVEVMERQLRSREPLGERERPWTIPVSGSTDDLVAAVQARLRTGAVPAGTVTDDPRGGGIPGR